MTGYTVHTGASKKFVAGWDNIFGNAANEDGGDKKTKKKSAKKTRSKSKEKKK